MLATLTVCFLVRLTVVAQFMHWMRLWSFPLARAERSFSSTHCQRAPSREWT